MTLAGQAVILVCLKSSVPERGRERLPSMASASSTSRRIDGEVSTSSEMYTPSGRSHTAAAAPGAELCRRGGGGTRSRGGQQRCCERAIPLKQAVLHPRTAPRSPAAAEADRRGDLLGR